MGNRIQSRTPGPTNQRQPAAPRLFSAVEAQRRTPRPRCARARGDVPEERVDCSFDIKRRSGIAQLHPAAPQRGASSLISRLAPSRNNPLQSRGIIHFLSTPIDAQQDSAGSHPPGPPKTRTFGRCTKGAMALCLSSCISSSQEQPPQVDETNLFLMFLPPRSLRSSRRGVVNNNQ